MHVPQNVKFLPNKQTKLHNYFTVISPLEIKLVFMPYNTDAGIQQGTCVKLYLIYSLYHYNLYYIYTIKRVQKVWTFLAIIIVTNN